MAMASDSPKTPTVRVTLEQPLQNTDSAAVHSVETATAPSFPKFFAVLQAITKKPSLRSGVTNDLLLSALTHNFPSAEASDQDKIAYQAALKDLKNKLSKVNNHTILLPSEWLPKDKRRKDKTYYPWDPKHNKTIPLTLSRDNQITCKYKTHSKQSIEITIQSHASHHPTRDALEELAHTIFACTQIFSHVTVTIHNSGAVQDPQAIAYALYAYQAINHQWAIQAEHHPSNTNLSIKIGNQAFKPSFEAIEREKEAILARDPALKDAYEILPPTSSNRLG